MFIRRAKLVELDSIMEIYEVARHYMINTGNEKQWGYLIPTWRHDRRGYKGRSSLCLSGAR